MVEKLFLPFRPQVPCGFVFEHHDGFDKRVRLEDSNYLAAKIHKDFHFALDFKASVSQCNGHGIRIHRLEVAGAKFKMNLMKNAHDPIRKSSVKQAGGHVAFRCSSVFRRATPWPAVASP